MCNPNGPNGIFSSYQDQSRMKTCSVVVILSMCSRKGWSQNTGSKSQRCCFWVLCQRWMPRWERKNKKVSTAFSCGWEWACQKKHIHFRGQIPWPFFSQGLCRKADIVGANLKGGSEDFHRKRRETRTKNRALTDVTRVTRRYFGMYDRFSAVNRR